MAIAFDSFSEKARGTTNRSWTHTPVGTPRGVIVFVIQDVGATDEVTGVTYGGDAMGEVALSPLLHTTGETSVAYCFFLGVSIPTGAQTVLVSVDGTGSDKKATAVSLTAADDCSVVDTVIVLSDSVQNPSATLSLGGITCFASIGFHSGIGAISLIEPLAGWNSRDEDDFGTATAGMYTYDTIGSTDVTAGWTQNSAQDATMIGIAIREGVVAAGGLTPRSYPRGANRGLMRGVA